MFDAGRAGALERAAPPLATARAAADSAGEELPDLPGGGATGRVASPEVDGRLPGCPDDGPPAGRFAPGAGAALGRPCALLVPGRDGVLPGWLFCGRAGAEPDWPGREGVPLTARGAALDEPDEAPPLFAGRAGPPPAAGRPFAGPPEDEGLPPPETLGDASVVIGDAPPPGFGADVLAGRSSFSGLTSHLHAQQPAVHAVRNSVR
ncbi:hypothetical protein JCM9957A_31170 [Kineosporia succinea]